MNLVLEDHTSELIVPFQRLPICLLVVVTYFGSLSHAHAEIIRLSCYTTIKFVNSVTGFTDNVSGVNLIEIDLSKRRYRSYTPAHDGRAALNYTAQVKSVNNDTIVIDDSKGVNYFFRQFKGSRYAEISRVTLSYFSRGIWTNKDGMSFTEEGTGPCQLTNEAFPSNAF